MLDDRVVKTNLTSADVERLSCRCGVAEQCGRLDVDNNNGGLLLVSLAEDGEWDWLAMVVKFRWRNSKVEGLTGRYDGRTCGYWLGRVSLTKEERAPQLLR
jgi:hypothetical protein